jgi:prolipoprotein diacylglyceryltransferase
LCPVARGLEERLVRPILFSIGNLYVYSYPAVVLLAVLISLAAVISRIRGRDVQPHVLARAIVITVLAGWVTGRAFPLFSGSSRALGWKTFSPLEAAPSSFTHFAIGASVALLAFSLVRRGDALVYLDALAPSALIGLGVAKFGCLLAGCCAGTVCPPTLGLSYPYGSDAYENQFRSGKLELPDELVRPPGKPDAGSSLWGHVQVLAARPEALARELERAGLNAGDARRIIALAETHRSIPVWPLPVFFGAATLALGVGAEWIYRTWPSPGLTLAYVLAAHGLLRLVFDSLLAYRGYAYAGMTLPQWVGAISLLLGAVVYVWIRKRTRASSSASHPSRGD